MQNVTKGKSITCHAWNKDGSMCALCPNNNEVLIVQKDGKVLYTLRQHDSVVTGIDWAPNTNRLVTCSQDRNAYVWTFDEEKKEWNPVLVILRINRAATWVRWSPDEQKFAVGSGAKIVSVCHFEEDNDWWVSTHVKGHRSTVTKVAWHPNSCLLATASTDFKARIFNCAVRGVDKRPAPSNWGAGKPFDKPLAEIDCNGWIQGIAFSPSGNRLCFVGHDSTVTIAEAPKEPGGEITTCVIKLKLLPMCDCMFLDESKVVVAGFDCAPYLVALKGPNQWELVKSLDDKKASAAAAPPKATATRAAFTMFQDKATKGTTDSSALKTTVETKHQNTITCIRAYTSTPTGVTEFTTSGLDGAIYFWK